MSLRSYLLPLAGLLLLTAHCGSDGDDDDDDDGTGGSTSTSGTGGSTSTSGTGGSTSTSSNSSSGSGDVETCQDLCDLAPVDSATAACVGAYVAGLGYDTSVAVCSSTDTNSPVGCMVCYDAIDITDGECIATHMACF